MTALLANWRLIGLAAIGLVFLSLAVALKMERVQNGKLKAQIIACSQARVADRAAYAAAQREAALKNKADVARIESEQERITHDISADLNSRLERLRRELRVKTAAPAPGASRDPNASPDGPSAGGADEAPRVCLTPGDVLRGAENEERHDQLITWVEKQLGIAR